MNISKWKRTIHFCSLGCLLRHLAVRSAIKLLVEFIGVPRQVFVIDWIQRVEQLRIRKHGVLNVIWLIWTRIKCLPVSGIWSASWSCNCQFGLTSWNQAMPSGQSRDHWHKIRRNARRPWIAEEPDSLDWGSSYGQADHVANHPNRFAWHWVPRQAVDRRTAEAWLSPEKIGKYDAMNKYIPWDIWLFARRCPSMIPWWSR